MGRPHASATPRLTLLFFVTEDYYFLSHRLPLALAAQRAGYDVAVVTRVRAHGDIIRSHGFRLIPFENARSSVNPIADVPVLARLVAVYRRERPAIVHHVAMKPVLYGSIAARLAGVPVVVNALTGMGWLFTTGHGLARWLKPAVRAALRYAVARGITIVQNVDDERLVRDLGGRHARVHRIGGSGVDLAAFAPSPEPPGTPVVLMHARLLWDKGAGDYVEAARLLRRRGCSARFVLAGGPDPLNPASIPSATIAAWKQEAIVELLGHVTDMPSLLASASVVCLPSYREGFPKSLIEAAAAGKPIVTTDVPGCRDVVRHGDNGLLVPPGNPEKLADAIEQLLGDATLRRALGSSGRRRAEREFGIDAVVRQTLAVYQEARA